MNSLGYGLVITVSLDSGVSRLEIEIPIDGFDWL